MSANKESLSDVFDGWQGFQASLVQANVDSFRPDKNLPAHLERRCLCEFKPVDDLAHLDPYCEELLAGHQPRGRSIRYPVLFKRNGNGRMKDRRKSANMA